MYSTRRLLIERLVLILGVMVLWGTTVVAADRASGGLPACVVDDISTQPASVAHLDPAFDSDFRSIEPVSPADLAQLKQGRLLVDLRPREQAYKHPVSGAMRLDLPGLRTLLRTTRREVLVFGAGDDDRRLSGRLAAWDHIDRLRLVRGGAPAIFIHSNQLLDDADLIELLATTPARALAAANSGDLNVLSVDPHPSHGSGEYGAVVGAHALRGLGADGKTPPGSMGRDSLGTAGLLIDHDEDRARSLALELSREHRTPVFYVPGGKGAIDEFLVRHAEMNRHPGLNAARCF